MTVSPVQVSVCIVAWNVREDLLTCLDSLAVAGRGVRTEVIVADNASTDGTVEAVEK